MSSQTRSAAVGPYGNQKAFLFHDESGRPGHGSHFVVGLLHVDAVDLPEVRRRVRDVRRKQAFVDELHFQKMSVWRERVYEAIILEMLGAPVRFSALVVENALLDMTSFGHQEHLCYNYFTKQLIFHRAKNQRRDYVVLTDEKPRLKRDNFIWDLEKQLDRELCLESGARIVRVMPVDSKNVALLQVCDLFTGLIANLAAAANPGSRKTELRRRLVASAGWEGTVDVWRWRPN